MFNTMQMVYLLGTDEVSDLCNPELSSEQMQERIKRLCEKTGLPWPSIYDSLQTKLRVN